jgi:hypothetical protein
LARNDTQRHTWISQHVIHKREQGLVDQERAKGKKKGSTNADVPLFAPRKIDRFNQSNTTE